MQRVEASLLASLSVVEREGFQKSMCYVMVMIMFLVVFMIVALGVCSGNLHTGGTTVMLS